MKEITIIIADDHPLFRSGVYAELENVENFKVVAEAGDGIEALNRIKELNPDVAVLDFQMPGLNGIEITRKLKEMKSETKVILLTMHNDRKTFLKAFDAGVMAFVLKEDAVLDIVKAINKVVLGIEFISSNLSTIILENIKNHSLDERMANLTGALSETEKKILSLIADLKSNDEISDILFISKRTVENHKVAITHKLQLQSSRELLKFAIQNKDFLNNP